MKCLLLLVVLGLSSAALVAQTAAPPSASEKLTFDVASVRENKSGNSPSGNAQYSNVPLGPGNVYSPTGGLLTITNYPLLSLINFAYKLTANQGQAIADMAPAWGREEHFDIKARTDKADVTKDELRLMMRTLLADRFGLAVHYEAKTMSVYAMQLFKPGTPGPRLRPHPADGCSRSFPKEPGDDGPAPPETVDGGYPAVCGGLLMMSSSTPTHWVIGARDVPISTISNALPSWGDLGRPVVDQTGLTGNYDFALEWTPERPALPAGSPMPADMPTPDFLESVKKQLGLKLESQKQSVQTLVLDHIDHLSDN